MFLRVAFRNQVSPHYLDCTIVVRALKVVRAPLPLCPINSFIPTTRVACTRQMDAAPHEHMGENGSQTEWIPAFEDYGVHGGLEHCGKGQHCSPGASAPSGGPGSSRRGHRWPYRRRPSNPVEAMLIWRVITTAASRVPPFLHSSVSKRGCRSVLEGRACHLLISPQIDRRIIGFHVGACSSHRTHGPLAGTHRVIHFWTQTVGTASAPYCNHYKHLPF